MDLLTGINDHGRRLDRILRKALPECPLPLIHKLLRKRLILIDGKPGFAHSRVAKGSIITIPRIAPPKIKPKDQGTGNRDQGTGNRDQRTAYRGQGAESREQVTINNEQLAISNEPDFSNIELPENPIPKEAEQKGPEPKNEPAPEKDEQVLYEELERLWGNHDNEELKMNNDELEEAAFEQLINDTPELPVQASSVQYIAEENEVLNTQEDDEPVFTEDLEKLLSQETETEKTLKDISYPDNEEQDNIPEIPNEQETDNNPLIASPEELLLSPKAKPQSEKKLKLKFFKPPDVLWQDAGLIAFNKPAGLQVHGFASLERMAQAYLFNKIPPSLSFKPGPLHRLDKPSSGIVIFSTSLEGAYTFSKLIHDQKVKKVYLAVVEGALRTKQYWTDYLYRDKKKKKTFILTAEDTKIVDKKNSKISITRVQPIKTAAIKGKPYTLIEAEIDTGRTHQIRAQSSFRGFPLAGDKKYGGASFKGGFFLHGWKIEFLEYKIEAPPPLEFQRLIDKFFNA